MILRYGGCNVLTKVMHKKKVMNLKRLNIVFEDKDFELFQQAKGEDTWTEALVKWANIVLKEVKDE